ncbi:MAG TPA: ORF6N domain-containing protein, partial [Puia sp.]
MLDFDLAELYEVATKALNQAVKRNNKRFPGDFMFRHTSREWLTMRSQSVTASQNKRNSDN